MSEKGVRKEVNDCLPIKTVAIYFWEEFRIGKYVYAMSSVIRLETFAAINTRPSDVLSIT